MKKEKLCFEIIKIYSMNKSTHELMKKKKRKSLEVY